MQCDNCHAELAPDSVSCPECGAPVLQEIEGFENTIEIQRMFKTIIVEHGKNITPRKLVALINDYLTDYEKERRLLVYMLNAGVLNNMLAENDHEIAIMRAKTFMLNECYITENAAEFALVCFTYMLKWPYKSTLGTGEKTEEKKTEEKAEDKKEETSAPLNIEAKVFRPGNALKYRLARNVTVPEGFTKIESFCFDGFGGIQTAKFPSTLLAIGEYAFSGCKHLHTVELPDSLKVIQQGAFFQCVSLSSIKIPAGVLEIEDNTFFGCESLEIVELPPTVSSIGTQAFSSCELLRKLFVPESVKFIDEDAFLECPELTIHCYENSYVHKYCLDNGINFKTVVVGAELRENMVKEG